MATRSSTTGASAAASPSIRGRRSRSRSNGGGGPSSSRSGVSYEPVSIEQQEQQRDDDDFDFEEDDDDDVIVSSSWYSSSAFFTPIAAAFFVLGLLNNASYVIMLASAKNISEGGTGLVYICSVFPGLLTKASAPYWYESVSYHYRVASAAAIMGAAFSIVGLFSAIAGGAQAEEALVGQLLGVAMISLQTALGESSLLALAGSYDAAEAAARKIQQQQRRQQAEDERAQRQRSNRSKAGTSATDETEQQDEQSLSPPPPAVSEPSTTTKGSHLTAFSSGTGLSGPFGYLWKIAWTEWIGTSLEFALLLAVSLAAAYAYVYRKYLWNSHHGVSYIDDDDDKGDAILGRSDGIFYTNNNNANGATTRDEQQRLEECRADNATETSPITSANNNNDTANTTVGVNKGRCVAESDAEETTALSSSSHDALRTEPGQCVEEEEELGRSSSPRVPEPSISDLNALQRFKLVASLWPYIVPLFTVYAAEYACEAGAWTAIGFPLESETARDHFYETSNWLYQAGVFLSRSSGTINLSAGVVYLMPVLQVGNLIFFTSVASAATSSFLYNRYLFDFLAFYTGLLGGAVYVHGYKRIVATVPRWQTEFSLAATSVAEGLGILMADILGLFIQACLYQKHGIEGSIVACPA